MKTNPIHKIVAMKLDIEDEVLDSMEFKSENDAFASNVVRSWLMNGWNVKFEWKI